MKMKHGIILITAGLLAVGYQVANAAVYVPKGVYVNAAMSFGPFAVDSLDGSTSTENNAILKKDRKAENRAGFEAAVGYAFESYPIRTELAYYKRAKLDYNIHPVFTNTTPAYDNLKSDISNQALMLNGYFDLHLSALFNVTEWVVPYLTAGVGVASNNVDLTAYNSSNNSISESKKTTALAWNAGIGMRIGMTNNIFFNLEFRHSQLGRAQWGPWSSDKIKIETKNITADEGFLGVTVFFGDQTPPPPQPELINEI